MADPTVRIEHWRWDAPPDSETDIYGFEAFDFATNTRISDDGLSWGPRKWPQRGVARFEVVGESFNMEGLQHAGFASGAPVELRIESNPHGVNGTAVAVYEASGRAQGGHIANRDVPTVLDLLLEGGGRVEAIVWQEVHRRRDGARCSLEVLVFRPGALYMDPRAPGRPARRQVSAPRSAPLPAAAAPPPRRGLLARILGR